MKLNVTNEVGRLRSVLIHLPGREIDTMIPPMMEELLFDDILFGQLAREEHRRFQQILWFVAKEVIDIQDLLAETLEDEESRVAILSDFCRRYSLDERIHERLRSELPKALADCLVGGIIGESTQNGDPVFDISPVPNLFFSRDPQVVIGSRVAISSMATRARQREAILSHYVFNFHPSFRSRSLILADGIAAADPADSRNERQRGTLEGGDVLVPRRDVLLIGASERTSKTGIENLATALKQSGSEIRTILLVEIPARRSYMHLDTVFTLVSPNECLVFPPVILEGGRWEAKVYELDLSRKELTYTAQRSLLDSLSRLGIDLEPIPCGGSSPINQEREQWTDGANAFAMAPGVILIYERNAVTAEELAKRGYHIIYEDDLLLGREEFDLLNGRKVAIQIQGHELSRARGGPRCMTMPLERDEI